jgi:thiamine-phosphate pyrophosphorylase
LWLMTDERIGAALWPALEALPRGAGVVFRHYRTPLTERRLLFARLVRIAQRRGLVLVRAGDTPLGRGEDGVHGSRKRARGLRTWPVHSRRDAIAGARAGADLLFVSPIFATRSHPRAHGIGVRQARQIVRGLPIRAVALGGITAAHGALLTKAGFWGWAAIDAWLPDQRPPQKRNAVPI